MTWVQVHGCPAGPIDRELLRTAARIVRRGSEVWVRALAEDVRPLQRGLALAGLGASLGPAPLPAAGLVPVIGRSLQPVAGPSLDVLILDRVPLAQATRLALGQRIVRRWLPRYRSARHDACRRLLRGSDELAWWERRAWVDPSYLRRAAIRSSFRPILFDADAHTAVRRGGVLHARAGAITAWMFP